MLGNLLVVNAKINNKNRAEKTYSVHNNEQCYTIYLNPFMGW